MGEKCIRQRYTKQLEAQKGLEPEDDESGGHRLETWCKKGLLAAESQPLSTTLLFVISIVLDINS